jgi:uncharacterized membrane protein
MLSAAYCNQISGVPFTKHCYINQPVIVIIQLLLLVSMHPKLITLSGIIHCITIGLFITAKIETKFLRFLEKEAL